VPPAEPTQKQSHKLKKSSDVLRRCSETGFDASTLACRPSAMILEGSSQNLSPLCNNWGRRPHSRPDTARPLRKRWRESISPSSPTTASTTSAEIDAHTGGPQRWSDDHSTNCPRRPSRHTVRLEDGVPLHVLSSREQGRPRNQQGPHDDTNAT
jgi:hypothetical protein